MTPEDIDAMGTKETYNYLISAIAANEVPPDQARNTLNKVRSGINIKFDIRLKFNGYITFIAKTNQYAIGGKLFHFADIENEIEERQIVIKRFLYENMVDGSVI